MKKSLVLLSFIGASALHASYVIKPDTLENYYPDALGKDSVQLERTHHIVPDEAFKWQYARYFEGEHKDDLYLRDLSINKDKVLAAGSYHSSVIAADLKTGAVEYNDFHSIKDADHGVLGVKYAEAESDANDGEWSGASELFVEQSEFIDAKTALVNAMPKYLGRENPDARPYLHQAGIHKVALDANGKISKTLAFAKGQYYLFRPYKGGAIAMADGGKFDIFDKNLKLQKSFELADAVKMDVAKDRLFVMLKGEQHGIYEYDIKHGKLKKIADTPEKGFYFGRPIKVTTSPFAVSKDASKIVYATPHNYNSQLCTVAVKNGKTTCGNAQLPLFAGSYALSPDGKYFAYTMGSGRGQTSVYDISSAPYLAGFAPGGITSYAAAFGGKNQLAVSNNKREIDVYELKKGGKITAEERFSDLKSRIFDFVAADMNAIKFKEKRKGDKVKIKTDLFLPQHFQGINITWLLPDEFEQFVNKKGKVFALPAKDYSGEMTAILQLVEDGKVVREEAVSHDFKLKAKRPKAK